MAYDVFISYRRENGSQMARLLQTHLQEFGYKVFLDVDELRAGHFDEALLREIESAKSFILVLSPGCLERCRHEGDWLRIEITHALQTRRKIVPIMLPGFQFPPHSDLPEELEGLDRHNGLSYSNEFFTAMMGKLCSYLGEPLQKATRRSTQAIGRRITAAVVASFLLLSGVLAFQYWHRPKTIAVADQHFLRSQASDIAVQLGRVNAELASIRDTARKATAYFTEHKNERTAIKDNDLELWAQHRLDQLEKNRQEPLWQKDRAAQLEKLGIPSEDVHSLYTGWFPQFWASVKEYYEMTGKYAKMAPVGWVADQARANQLSADTLGYEADAMYYGAFSLFSHFPESALEDFQKMRSQFTHFPSVPGMLAKADAERQMEISLNKYNEALNEMTLIVGNADVAVQKEEKKIQGSETSIQALLLDIFENLEHLDVRLQATSQYVDAALAQNEETLPRIRREGLETCLNNLRVLFNGEPVAKSYSQALNQLVIDSGFPPDGVRKVYGALGEVDYATEAMLSVIADWAKEDNKEKRDYWKKRVILERDRFWARAQSAHLAGIRLLIMVPEPLRGSVLAKISAFTELRPNRVVPPEDLATLEQRNTEQTQEVVVRRAELTKEAGELLRKTQEKLDVLTAKLEVKPTDSPDDIAEKAWKCRRLGYSSKARILLDEYIKRFPSAAAPERKYAETAKAFIDLSQSEKIEFGWYIFTVESPANTLPCPLKEGDILTRLNGEPFEEAKVFFDYFKNHPGEACRIELLRPADGGQFEKKSVEFQKDRKIGLMGI